MREKQDSEYTKRYLDGQAINEDRDEENEDDNYQPKTSLYEKFSMARSPKNEDAEWHAPLIKYNHHSGW